MENAFLYEPDLIVSQNHVRLAQREMTTVPSTQAANSAMVRTGTNRLVFSARDQPSVISGALCDEPIQSSIHVGRQNGLRGLRLAA